MTALHTANKILGLQCFIAPLLSLIFLYAYLSIFLTIIPPSFHSWLSLVLYLPPFHLSSLSSLNPSFHPSWPYFLPSILPRSVPDSSFYPPPSLALLFPSFFSPFFPTLLPPLHPPSIVHDLSYLQPPSLPDFNIFFPSLFTCCFLPPSLPYFLGFFLPSFLTPVLTFPPRNLPLPLTSTSPSFHSFPFPSFLLSALPDLPSFLPSYLPPFLNLLPNNLPLFLTFITPGLLLCLFPFSFPSFLPSWPSSLSTYQPPFWPSLPPPSLSHTYWLTDIHTCHIEIWLHSINTFI